MIPLTGFIQWLAPGTIRRLVYYFYWFLAAAAFGSDHSKPENVKSI